jgi:hypothetical protein
MIEGSVEATMKIACFIGLFALVAATPVQADPRDDTLSAMLRCSGISDRAQRLTCYDASVVRIPGALNNAAVPPPPAMASAVPPAAAPVARRQHSSAFVDKLFGPDGPKRAAQTTVAEFGSESIANGGREAYPIPMDDDTIDQISARLVNYQFVDGYVIVTLDNGQMWRETAGTEPLQHLTRPALSYTAIIGRGGSGSYSLKLSGVAREIPVRRIR